MKYTKILGTGSYLPEEVLTNYDLESMVKTTHDWIVERTGIHARHRAPVGVRTVDLAVNAAKKALEMAGVSVSDLDLIIGTTGTPDNIFPSMACDLQKELGATCAAFDVQAACSGFIYGLSVADQFIKTGAMKTILLVSAETMSRLVDWSDRSTCILFGDGAGAVVLQASEDPGILSTHLYADGQYGDLLKVKNPQAEYYGAASTGRGSVFMDGPKVFKLAVTRLEELVQHILDHHQIQPHQIDWLVPHQANNRIIEATAAKLSMPLERVVRTLATQGNTSSASIPLALDLAVRDGRIQRGHHLLLEAFGAGLTWGAAFIRF